MNRVEGNGEILAGVMKIIFTCGAMGGFMIHTFLCSMPVIIPSCAVMYMIATGILALPMWCLVMNPLVFQVIGLLLRATKLKCFIDAPSICAASLGLAAFGVLALV